MRLLTLAFLLLHCTRALAQTDSSVLVASVPTTDLTQLAGSVTNSDAEPLPSAQLILRDGRRIGGYGMTDANGNFALDVPAVLTDSMTLEVRYFGYAARTFTLLGLPADSLQPVILRRQNLQLQEVVVASDRLPATYHQDTTSFQTERYRDGGEQKIEEVIAKLPGVEVSEDGRIEVNGKPLDRMLVDGEDLFDKNYRLLSRNVPANFVTQIDVLNNYHPDQLVGDLSGEREIVMDLQLDENRKGFVFGEASAEVGNAGYRDVGLRLFHFGKRAKVVNFTDHATEGYASKAGGALEQAGSDALRLQPAATPVLGNQAQRQRRIVPTKDYLRNNALGSAQSFLFNLNDNVKNRLIFNASRDHYGLRDDRLREIIQAERVDSFAQRNRYDYRNRSLWLRNDLEALLSPKSRIDVRVRLALDKTLARTDTDNQQLGTDNFDALFSELDDRPFSLLTRLAYVRRINERTGLNVSGYFQRDHYRQGQRYRGDAYAGLLPELSGNDLRQGVDQRHFRSGVTAVLLRSVGRNKLSYQAEIIHHVARINSELSAEDGGENVLGQLRRFELLESNLGVAWHRTFGRLTLGTGFTLAHYHYPAGGNEVVLPADRTPRPQGRLNVEYKPGRRHTLVGSASHGVSTLGPDQFIGGPYLADQGSLSTGLDSIFLQRNRSASVGYSFKHLSAGVAASLSFSHSSSPEQVVSQLTATDFVVVDQLVAGGSFTMNTVRSHFSFYPLRRTHVKLKASLTHMENALFVLGELETTTSERLSLGGSSTSAIGKRVQYTLAIDFNQFENTIFGSSSVQRQIMGSNRIRYIISQSLTAQLDHKLYLPRLDGSQSAIHLAEAKIDYRPKKSDWTWGGGVNNLFNQGSVVERRLGVYQRYARAYRLQPRTFYASATYSF